MRVVASLVFAGLTVLAGCGSIIKGGTDEVTFQSTPSEAQVTIVDEAGHQIFNGETPATVTLNKKSGYFAGKTYQVTVQKAGHKPLEVTLKTEVNAWYVGGNIIFGGLIGWLIVDPLTGGMWTIAPEEIDAAMEPMVSRHDDGTLAIALLENVPSEMRDALIALD